MKPFEFHHATSLADAAEVLGAGNGGARLLAGGQSLLLKMKTRELAPEVLVSIGHLDELKGWHYDGEELVLGACTTYASLAGADLRPGPYQLISDVAGSLADIAVRNVGTVGGAMCEADPGFDFPVLALTLSAGLDISTAKETRTTTVADFYAQPAAKRLELGEILSRLRFRALPASSGAAFEKFRYRQFDAALTSVGCVVDVSGGEVRSAVVAIGGATATPTRLAGAEAALVGQRVTEEVAAAVAEVAMAEAEVTVHTPFATRDYRRHLVGALTRRATVRAYEESGG